MKKKDTDSRKLQNFIIITGLSGSGMSSATNAFEDLGFFCVDNLPITMLSTFARLLKPNSEEVVAIEKAALVINIRERHFLSEFPNELSKLKKKKIKPFILFFEASDKVLQRRFSETRRPHPTDEGKGVLAAIRAEKEAMKNVREMADMIIDTSEHTVHTLRRKLLKTFSEKQEGVPLQVHLFSFGHKHGLPGEVDILFDVRHLPNPYFEKDLKTLPGTNSKVIKFLEEQEDVNETLGRFTDLMTYLLPLYKREGKSYLTIGIGCTGGRHRSVYITNALGKKLESIDFEVKIGHRDVQK